MKKILCYLFGHKYKLVKRYNYNCQKLQCKRCNKYFGINYTAKILLTWDKELEYLHENEIIKQSVIQK